MFCPMVVDYGNVADWIAGLGSLAAVMAALWIASGQSRAAEKLRLIAKNEAVERRTQVISEAIRLAADIEARAGSYSMLTGMGGGEGEAKKADLMDEISGLRSQLEALQHFPMTDPRVFTEIGRVAHESRFEPGFALTSTSHAGLTMKRTAERMRDRRDALVKL